MELLTTAQMRAIEQAAIDSGQVTGLELMERAGAGVVEAILEWRPELAEGERSAVVLCGPGNNGGDGFVVARLLKERGWTVKVLFAGKVETLPPDARIAHGRFSTTGVESQIEPLSEQALRDVSVEEDIIVDAIFGAGLSRPVDNPSAIRDVLTHMDGRNGDREYYATCTVAVDCPSGICMDSGRVLGAAPFAALTVTFHRGRIGHHLNDGALRTGRLAIADIGLEKGRRLIDARRTRLVGMTGYDGGFTASEIIRSIDKAETFYLSGHKYDHGHALTLSGGMGSTGAARLAARGALRIGAGLVTVGSPADAMAENAAHLTAIMLREVDDTAAFAKTLEDKRINALCLGPGMGVGHKTELLVKQALAAKRATVLDADALTVFANDPSALFALLHDRCVLTPHEGEFGRLFPDILEKLRTPATIGPAYSKVDATREAAARAGCTVLFKGADTVIADPHGSTSINSAHYERAAPWLATAGSGDVLAGFITGLLARGLSTKPAAEYAAWLHVECGRSLGPGLIAEDIPEALPAVLKQVLKWIPPAAQADA